MFRETKMPSAFALRFGFCIRKKSNLGYYRSQTFFFFFFGFYFYLFGMVKYISDRYASCSLSRFQESSSFQHIARLSEYCQHKQCTKALKSIS